MCVLSDVVLNGLLLTSTESPLPNPVFSTNGEISEMLLSLRYTPPSLVKPDSDEISEMPRCKPDSDEISEMLGQVLFLVEIIEAGGFNSCQSVSSFKPECDPEPGQTSEAFNPSQSSLICATIELRD